MRCFLTDEQVFEGKVTGTGTSKGDETQPVGSLVLED